MLDVNTAFATLTGTTGTISALVKWLIDLLLRPLARQFRVRLDWRYVAFVLAFALAAIAVPFVGLSFTDPQGLGLFVLSGLGGAKGAMVLTDEHDKSHDQEPGT